MEGILVRLGELLVILLAAKVGSEVMARLNQPTVIGELLMGMIVGVGVLGWVNVEDGPTISVLAEIGVILLLFEVGLETDLREFVRLGGPAAAVAVVGVVTPFVLGFLFSRAVGLGGGGVEVAIFMGAAMTATSVGITARVFADLGRLNTDEAKTVIGAAVIDDILGLIILAVVAGLLGSGGEFDLGLLGSITLKAVVFLALVVAMGIRLAPFYFRFLERLKVEGSFVVGSFAFAVALGLLAEWAAGLEPIVGAFAAGLVAGQTGYSHRIRSELRAINHLFIPIFFLSIGARVDVGVLVSGPVLLAGLGISVLAMVGKLAAGAAVLPLPMRSPVVGVGMIPRGEVGLIFAALGTERLAAVVGSEEAGIVVLMVVITTVVAPLVLHRMLLHEAAPREPGPAPLTEYARDRPVAEGPEIDETAQEGA